MALFFFRAFLGGISGSVKGPASAPVLIRQLGDCRVELVAVEDGCHVLLGEGASCSTIDGIATERDWIDENYPGHTMLKQSMTVSKRKPQRKIDRLKVRTAAGQEVELCFDLTDLWKRERVE